MTSRYDRLADHLATREDTEITLTFAEVEAIIDPLPTAARHDAGWWGTGYSGHYFFAHTGHWAHVGYAPDTPDLAAATVTFRRVAE